MFTRLFKGNTDTIRIVSKLLLMVTMCIATVMLLLCTAGFIICNIDFTYESLPVIIAVILSISAALDGFIISRISKENGLLWGFFAGMVILIFVLILSFVMNTFNMTSDFFTKSAICIIAGAIGGIAGVNVN